MIGKAAFWLGVTVLLTPHEPDIGLGRPSATYLAPAGAERVHDAPQTSDFAAILPRELLSLKEDFQRWVPQARADIQYSLRMHRGKREGMLHLPPDTHS